MTKAKEETQEEELGPLWDPQPKPELEPKPQTQADIEAQQTTGDGPGMIEGFGFPDLNIRPETPYAEAQAEGQHAEGTEPPAEGEDVAPHHKRKRR
jgi:hypothetical protein